MKDWWFTNGLAAYGAVVGTIALLLNLWKFFYDRTKDAVQLSVSCTADSSLRSNIERVNTERAADWDGPNLLPGYLLKVTNIGSVPAHIADAGMISDDGSVTSALVAAPGRPMILESIARGQIEPLQPKAARTFTVYVQRGVKAPKPVKAFVEDATGRRWTRKFKA